MNEKITDRMMQFGMWLGKPERLRKPKRLEEFGELIGVTRQTLSRWKKDPAVIDIAQNYKKLEALLSLDEVIENMTERAKRENPSCRTFLQWLGELDKSEGNKAPPLGKIQVEFVTKNKDE